MQDGKTSKYAKFFTSTDIGSKTPKVKCNFCNVQLAKNGTRMMKHLIDACKKVPSDRRSKFRDEQLTKKQASSEKDKKVSTDIVKKIDKTINLEASSSKHTLHAL